MAYSVNVSVEAPIENQIQEITYDGQEIYQALVYHHYCR
jgi:mediator of RNA polymerase II transcription subunit 17